MRGPVPRNSPWIRSHASPSLSYLPLSLFHSFFLYLLLLITYNSRSHSLSYLYITYSLHLTIIPASLPSHILPLALRDNNLTSSRFRFGRPAWPHRGPTHQPTCAHCLFCCYTSFFIFLLSTEIKLKFTFYFNCVL